MPVEPNPATAPAPNDSEPSTGLRFRAILLGVPLVILLAFVTVYGDMVVQRIQIGILQFAPPAISGLFILVLATRFIRWALKRQWLSRQDLFPIYVMMTISVLMCSRGTIEKLIPPLIHTNYFATEENKYTQLFGDYLPSWLVVFNPEGADQQDIAKDYYEGNATVPWRLWVGPILSWTGLLTFVYLTFFCLSAILRRQWADNEKLVFPLVTLPLTMMEEDQATPFFKNPLTWFGVMIPVVVFGINALHANISAVPEIKLSWQLNQYLTTRPWNGMYNTRLVISFAAIGFFYFLASDLLLSLWLFFVLTRVTDLLGTQMGYDMVAMPQYPTRLYVGYQVAGAYTVLVVYLMYAGWQHFGPVLKSLFKPDRLKVDDGPSEEMIPLRLAGWGVIFGFIGSVIWCRSTGLDWWLAIVELGVYLFIVAVVLSRGVAEAGLLQTEASFRPVDLVKLVRPQWTLGPRNLTMLSMLDTVLTRDLRGVLLSNFLDNQKIAKELKYRPRSLVLPIWIAIFVALVAGCYFFLTISYDYGNVTLYGYPRGNADMQVREAATAMQQHVKTAPAAPIAYAFGLVFCTALVVLRSTQVWWPLHPLAYAVCASWTLLVFWFSAFLTWAIKGFILRSGGMKTYRRMMPLFLGMILGTFLMAFGITMVVFIGRLYNVDLMAPSLGFD